MLDQENVVLQIINLVNSYNNLKKPLSFNQVLHGNTKYLWLGEGEVVKGVVGVERNNYLLTRIKHLSVSPDFRRQKLGEQLVNWALQESGSRWSYCSVREDNAASLSLFKKIGFEQFANYTSSGVKINLLLSRKLH